jgi:hypothetical protein
MTLDEVRRAIQAHSPGIRIDETRGIVNNVAATDYLSWVIARGNQRGSDGSGDAIGVHFRRRRTPIAPSSSSASPVFPPTSIRCSRH